MCLQRRRRSAELTNVHLPLLPLDHVPVHLEADALRLDNVQRLDVVAELHAFLLKQIREEIVRFLGRRDALPICPLKGILAERQWCSCLAREIDVEA